MKAFFVVGTILSLMIPGALYWYNYDTTSTSAVDVVAMSGQAVSAYDTVLDNLDRKFSDWDEDRAKESGYSMEEHCVGATSFGFRKEKGAMGFLALHKDAFEDNDIDPMNPEGLLFDGDGAVVGLKWSTRDTSFGSPPTLFGQAFTEFDPYSAHERPHYGFVTYFNYDFGRKHTWNPNLKCPGDSELPE